MPLMLGFGRNQFPVRVARRHIAREGPHVGDIGDAIGAAVDDVAVAIAGGGDELGLEAHSKLGRARLQLGGDDVGGVDRDETRLDRLAALFALADRGVEAIIDVAREQVLERAAVALGEGDHDHLVGAARAGDEVLGVEAGVGRDDGIEAGCRRRTGFGDALPAQGRICRLHRLGRFGRRDGLGLPRQGHDLLARRRPDRLTGGIGIIRRPLAACPLAEDAAQAQENEHRKRQEDDGVDVEHVLHAFGYRDGRLFGAVAGGDGMAAGPTGIM
jgi:hypothetical protein